MELPHINLFTIAPQSDRVNLAVLELKENGELEELIEKWWNDGACAGDDDGDDDGGSADEDDFDQLNLSELAGAFYVLIAALAISVVVWLLETRSK
ncbi:Glutamate receptor 1 [Orchesella cincta]|uniref:Glutamate receptor 1 n=1 Tax=Orchesella cincta TaxID=48709 RepID=A0A1D2NKL1_ORCCI|nr:Glutamate receptor 1 [Orchesella cincta]